MSVNSQLIEAYHKIVEYEYSKYEKEKGLEKTFVTLDEIKNKLNINENVIKELINRGYLLKIDDNRYHSLLMDLAYRASDIRVKRGGNVYVLEKSLKLIKKPLLRPDYVLFDRNDQNLADLKNVFNSVLNDQNLVDKFIEALKKASVTGLSSYQYDSIKQLLTKDLDAVISAPTAFGKTYIFLIPILLHAVKAIKEGRRGPVAVLFYPRKALGSDQMTRIVRLVYYVNRLLGVNITVGIDDRDTGKIKEGEKFRGVRCPVHPDEFLEVRQGKAYCPTCNTFYDFIKVTRGDIANNPPHILVTNIWAYQYRLISPQYWRTGYFSSNTKFFVFDEVHLYRGLVAGILSYFIQILKSLISRDARIILSSATIPYLHEFVQDITGLQPNNILMLEYDENKYPPSMRKLELYLLVAINPITSWETYTGELAIFLSTVSRLRKKASLDPVQSLIFVDSLREILRLNNETDTNIRLGDPEDHLKDEVPPEETYCYWIYNPNYRNPPTNVLEALQNEIKENIATHYSEDPGRYETEEKIKRGDIDVVIATSTLEVGVDYDNVMVVVNAGIPFSLESVIQRVGRAGRKDSTLFTSLAVIVVRNNPLEYYYIYKGIEHLIDLSKLPKIPVSRNNLYVIAYSAFLYALASLAKNGHDARFINKVREPIELNKLIDEVKNLLNSGQLKNIGIPPSVDINPIISKFEEVSKLLPKAQEIPSPFEAGAPLDELIKDLNTIKNDIDKTLLEMTNTIKKNQNNSKIADEILKIVEKLRKNVSEIPNDLSSLDDPGKVADVAKKMSNEITNGVDEITNMLKTRGIGLDELSKYLKGFLLKLNQYTEDLDKVKKRASDISVSEITSKSSKTQNVSSSSIDENLIRKYSDIVALAKTNLRIGMIDIIERIIGFKFMGNEIIDLEVEAQPEHYSEIGQDEDKLYEEELLSNIINRTPPFEMTTIPKEDKEQREISRLVGARYFWLVKPKYGKIITPPNYWNELKQNKILKGTLFEVSYDLNIPSKINYVDVLTLEDPIILELTDRKGDRPDRKENRLYIKYGTYRKSLINQIKDKIIKLYNKELNPNELKELKNRLTKIDQNIRKFNSYGLNFRYVAFCKLGRCISTDPFDKKCPVKIYCRVDNCDGVKINNKIVWTGITSRKIFPKFNLRLAVEVRNLPLKSEPLVYELGTITYDQLKDEIKLKYDRAYVSLPYWFNNFINFEFEIEPIGYTAKTSFVYLKLNEAILNAFIEHIITYEPELTKLLMFKFFIYDKLDKGGVTILEAVTSYNEFKPDNVPVDDFKKYLRKSLLHSLAHMLYIYLVRELVPIDTQRINYWIDYDTLTIYVYENSKQDGLGLVETVAQLINRNGMDVVFKEFLQKSKDFLEKHNKSIENEQKALQNQATQQLAQLANDSDIKSLLDAVDSLNKKIDNSNLGLDAIDIVSYRYLLADELNTSNEKKLTEYIIPAVLRNGKPSLCLDGCESCLVFSRGCTESFYQNYIISKRLLLEFINFLLGKSITIVTQGVKGIFEGLFKNAQEIRIKTPYMDQAGLKELENAIKAGTVKKVEITLGKLTPLLKKRLNNLGLSVNIDKDFHSKIYELKSGNQLVSISGSANLTKSSLTRKEENLTITVKINEDNRQGSPGTSGRNG